MKLIARLIEPTKNYISFRNFLAHLSGINNEPLYDVVTYLLHHDLNSMGFYHIDTDYKIIKFSSDEFNTVHEFLEKIQKALIFGDDKWVFSDGTSLKDLSDDAGRSLTTTIYGAAHCFFKKSELLSFDPLNGLLHFDSKADKSAPISQAVALGTYQKLLITYELFTHEQIVCLITNQNPACVSHDDEYHAHWDMVQNALDSGSLVPVSEKGQIPASQVKQWLSRHGFIYKSFNDNLPSDSDRVGTPSIQSLPPDSDQVADLKRQLADAQEGNAKKQARIEELERLLEQKTSSQSASGPENNNWCELDEHTYPPELHLSLIAWQRIYKDNAIENQHVDSHSGKFKVIAGQLGLDPESTLGRRVGMICTPYRSKKSQPSLVKQLRAIESINSFE